MEGVCGGGRGRGGCLAAVAGAFPEERLAYLSSTGWCTVLKSLTIRSFRSLANIELRFESLTLLVGPNGSGKSNVIDALRFVTDALATSLAVAVSQRGGLRSVRRVSRGHPRHFGFRLLMTIPDEDAPLTSEYSFEIGTEPGEGGFSVRQERCLIHREDGTALRFETRNGLFVGGAFADTRLRQPDQLALPLVANVAREPEFFRVLEELTRMRFYSPVPDRIREPQDPTEGNILLPDGSNAVSVVRELRRHHSEDYALLCELLGIIVPGVASVTARSVGNKETLQFHQLVDDQENPWRFDPGNMSDGTIRVLAILLAMYQPNGASLIAIEEPESTVHPAAADVIVDVLRAGSRRSQVLVTTHSPDILDSTSIASSEIRVVEKVDGRTELGSLGARSRDAIQGLLYLPGELLKLNELDRAEVEAPQLELFPRSRV